MPTYYCHNCNHQVIIRESVYHLCEIAGDMVLEDLIKSGIKKPPYYPTLSELAFPSLSWIPVLLNRAGLCCDKPAYSPYPTAKEQHEACRVLTPELITKYNARKG